jgi:multidrug efflux system membrane fusion protein
VQTIQKRFQSKILFLMTTFLLIIGCEASDEQGFQPPPPSVSVAEVISKKITEWDEFTGRLESPQSVELRPRVSGYVEKVFFVEGSKVKAGDLLLQIDDRTLKAEMSGLEAQLNSAKSQLILAKSEYDRAKQLSEKKAISDEILDKRLAQKESAEATVKTVSAELDIVKLNVSHARVVAPIDGQISRAMATKGNYVSAGETILTTLVSTKTMHAYFSADERTYLRYAKMIKNSGKSSSSNTVFMALINDEGYPHKGVIDFIDNQINPSTGTIQGRAVFENNDGLFLSGMFTRLRLTGSEAYDAILINDKAIGTDLNKKFVLVVDAENNAQYRPVVLGEKVEGLRIILSGLKEGEKIVVNGLQRVRPGTPVTPEVVPMADESTLNSLELTQNHSEKMVKYSVEKSQSTEEIATN